MRRARSTARSVRSPARVDRRGLTLGLGLGLLLSCDPRTPDAPGLNCFSGCGACECDARTGFIDNPGDTGPCVCGDGMELVGDYCFPPDASGSTSIDDTYSGPSGPSGPATDGTDDTLETFGVITISGTGETEDPTTGAATTDETSGTTEMSTTGDPTTTGGDTEGDTCGDMVVDDGEDCDEGQDPSPTCSPECVACDGAPEPAPALIKCGDSCVLADVAYNDLQSRLQVFRASTSGWLAGLRVRMSNAAAATNQVELRVLALPDPLTPGALGFSIDDNVIALASSSMTEQMAWQPVEFDPTPTITAGEYYAIVARLVGDVDPGLLGARWETRLEADVYPPGDAYSCALDCPAWEPANGTYDHLFEVLVVPVCQ
ncbi:MAG: hypothetical protein H6713_17985 [Myxococcales bacterium]|nr:hypothetical protein [Myxococcales bacterium]